MWGLHIFLRGRSRSLCGVEKKVKLGVGKFCVGVAVGGGGCGRGGGHVMMVYIIKMIMGTCQHFDEFG